MDKVLSYTLREEDLAVTAGGLVNLILKNCVKVTGHEISGAKFLPDGITVDGRLVHVSERIAPGQTLRIILPEDEDRDAMVPARMPRGGPEILYEDEDIVILNKPAGIVSHPSPGHYADSMANYLAGYYKDKGEDFVCRLVGRLDKETSGTLLFAKNRAACARLFRERSEDALRRIYLAIVHGTFPEGQLEGTIEGNIDAAPGVLMLRQVTGDGSGLRAVTQYRVLAQRREEESEMPLDPEWVEKTRTSNTCGCVSAKRLGATEDHPNTSMARGRRPDSFDASVESEGQMKPCGGGISLVQCHILTGRTHQIRLHMASIGHPLVGDTLYGPEAQVPDPDGHIASMPGEKRALLHAARITLIQPFTGEKIEVGAPLPSDFQCFSGYNFS